jgi:hypothetical protein
MLLDEFLKMKKQVTTKGVVTCFSRPTFKGER